jgi:hypothetical protein
MFQVAEFPTFGHAENCVGAFGVAKNLDPRCDHHWLLKVTVVPWVLWVQIVVIIRQV